MNHWLANSLKNLLPLSKADEFKDALGEWFFTGEVDDYEGEDADIVRELCEHPDLVHHFHIKNAHTGNSLLVGSSCILKFQQIEVRDKSGRVIIDPSLRKRVLDVALRTKIVDSSLIPLRKLWRVEKPRRNEIEYLASAIKLDQGLSPTQLNDLLAYFDKHQIGYSAKSYKVNLRSYEASYQLTVMSQHQFERMSPAFSKAQLARARKVRREA